QRRRPGRRKCAVVLPSKLGNADSQRYLRPIGVTPGSNGLRPSRVRTAFTARRAPTPVRPGRAAPAAALSVLRTSCGPQIGDASSHGAALSAAINSFVALVNS